MDELNEQRQQRIKKLDQLRQAGVAPYGSRFEVKDRAGQLIALCSNDPKAQAAFNELLLSKGYRVETHAGSGYWSQSSAIPLPTFSGKADRLQVRWDVETLINIPTTMLIGIGLVIFAFALALACFVAAGWPGLVVGFFWSTEWLSLSAPITIGTCGNRRFKSSFPAM